MIRPTRFLLLLITALLLAAFVTSVVVAQTATKAKPKSDTVYITDTGTKFHRSGCRSLKKSKTAISRSDAVKQGYTACKVCKP